MNGLKWTILLAVASLTVPAQAGAAVGKADLAVASLSGVPSSAAPGAAVKLGFAVVDKGRKRAAGSRLALSLSRDARAGKGDLPLGGASVKALAPRKRVAGRVTVTVPRVSGAWRIIACADGARRLREASEANNCRASAVLTVSTAAPAGPAAPSAPAAGNSAPPSAPEPTPSPTPQPTPEPGGDPAPVHTAPAPPAAAPLEAVAITDGAPQHVVRFHVDAPGTLLGDIAITGLQAGELLADVDLRPATGRLVATSTAGRVLQLDPATGAATPVFAAAAFGAAPYGQDFDPAADRLHSVDGTALHLSYDPGTGTTAGLERLSYLAGDPHAGATPAVGALAFTESYASALGARMLGIDTAADALVDVTDQPLGLMRTIGPIGVDAGPVAGLDVAGAGADQRVFALLAAPSAARSSLYRVDTATGAAAAVGPVGASGRYRGLALLPAPLGEPLPAGIQAASDAFTPADPQLEQLLLPLDRMSVCPADQAYRALALPEALASARDFLRREAGQAALDAYAAAPEYDDAFRSVGVAAVAISRGKPGAALAALLRAHDLRPGDATILLNAGSVASSVGLGSEALAMIRAAEKLPAPARSPMGLDWTGRVQLAYAGASVSLAQWDNAETAAASGRAHEPDLGSEAAGMLTAVDLCRDDDLPAAAKHRARADRRNADPAPIDESGGHAMALRNIPLPALPANAAADAEFYESFVGKLSSETLANSGRRQQLLPLLDKDAAPAVERRRDGLMARAMDVSDAAEPQALFERASDAIDAAAAVHEDMFGTQGQLNGFTEDAGEACQGVPDADTCFTNEMRSRCRPAMNIAHSAWLDHVTEAYRAEQQRIELISRRMSAIGANFADPDHLQYVLASIEGDEIAAANLVVQQAYSWTVALRGFAEYCVESPQPTGQPVPEKPQATGYNCPPELKALAVKAELAAGVTEAGDSYALGIKVNCEEVETEGSITTLPFLNAFGSVNYSAKSGETTLVIGGKFAMGGTPVQGDFQSGVYVKFGSKGQFSDVGWRIGPTIAAGTSLAEYSAGDTMDLSFVEGVKYLSSADPSGG